MNNKPEQSISINSNDELSNYDNNNNINNYQNLSNKENFKSNDSNIINYYQDKNNFVNLGKPKNIPKNNFLRGPNSFFNHNHYTNEIKNNKINNIWNKNYEISKEKEQYDNYKLNDIEYENKDSEDSNQFDNEAPKFFRSKVLVDKDNNINKYKNEIGKLKKEIEELENANDLLSNEVKEEEKRNQELNILKKEKEENDNSILGDIANCLQVDSFDEILPKLTEMIEYLNKYNNSENSKIKEELISNLKMLYLNSTNSKGNKNNVSIIDLWRWIKNLINEVKELSIEKKKNEEMYKEENFEIYKNYCDKLIKEFKLNSFDELKFFINDLFHKNNINKKRVEKLRKVLMNNNEKDMEESDISNNIIKNNDVNYSEDINKRNDIMGSKHKYNFSYSNANYTNEKFNDS